MNRSSRLVSLAVLALLLPSAPASAAVVVNNVTVIDGTGRPARPGQYVLIDREHIVAIRDHVIPAPAGATVLDGRGKFLIPGMADIHIHLARARDANGLDTGIGRRLLQGYLYSGVTFVYDANNYDKYIFGMRAAERSGQMLSPRIFATGYLIAHTNGYGAGAGYLGDPLAPTAATYEEGVKALDALFREKPDLVKFILAPHGLGGVPLPTFEPELLHRLLMYTNEHGFRTTIHAVEATAQRAAVEGGVNALAHPVYMTATDDKLAPLIATKGIPVTTTLTVIRSIFNFIDDPKMYEDTPAFRALLTDADIAHFVNTERASWVKQNLGPWSHQIFAYAKTNVRKLYDAGAILALGTDRTIGEYVPEELEVLVGLGIPPIQALRIATLNAAIYLHTADRMGSVEEGKLADLVVLNSDPTKDIRNVRDISTVILGGTIVDRGRLKLPINHNAN